MIQLGELSRCINITKSIPEKMYQYLNTLGPRQNGCNFADGIFECNFLNENVWISIKISLKILSKGPVNNISALV